MAVSLETEDKAEPWFDDDWGPVTHQQRIVRRLLNQESLLDFPKKYVFSPLHDPLCLVARPLLKSVLLFLHFSLYTYAISLVSHNNSKPQLTLAAWRALTLSPMKMLPTLGEILEVTLSTPVR